MEKQEIICRVRDEVASVRHQLSDLQTELEQAKDAFRKVRAECNHTYVGKYHGKYEGTSAMSNGECEICEDWE